MKTNTLALVQGYMFLLFLTLENKPFSSASVFLNQMPVGWPNKHKNLKTFTHAFKNAAIPTITDWAFHLSREGGKVVTTSAFLENNNYDANQKTWTKAYREKH